MSVAARRNAGHRHRGDGLKGGAGFVKDNQCVCQCDVVIFVEKACAPWHMGDRTHLVGRRRSSGAVMWSFWHA